MTTRQCRKCLEDVDIKQFNKNKNRPGGLADWCRPCVKEYNTEWFAQNKELKQDMDRRAYLKSKFGISPEQYEELLQKQNGICPICEKHHTVFKRRLAVDHNHHTGEIRGLLCTFCNHRFIGRNRDPAMFTRGAEYLSGSTGWFVPKKKERTVRRRPKRN